VTTRRGDHASAVPAPDLLAEGGAPIEMSFVVILCDWWYLLTMKQIAAAKFKEQCLSILDDVAEEGLVITKHGKPVAKLIPIRAESASLIGALKGKMTIKGNILSTEIRWRAQS
jgi:prevent-host-death family protein